MPDYKEKWLQKAEIDYFSPFVSLWLACNSWYNSHYAEVNNKDRSKINAIKADRTKRNHIYCKFERLIKDDNPNGRVFKSNLEQLIIAVDEACLIDQNGQTISFNNIEIEGKRVDLKVKVTRTKTGRLTSKYRLSAQDLGKICVTNDILKLFAGTFEIIYQIRCLLVHGSLNPEEKNHAVVKYCYYVLWDILQFNI